MGLLDWLLGTAEGLVDIRGASRVWGREGCRTRPKLYSEQFKADAVALVESGMSRRQVCADLGVSRSSLQKWITDARLQAHGMSPSSDPEVAKEMSAALKPIRELEARKRSPARRSSLREPGGDSPKKIFVGRGKTDRSRKGNLGRWRLGY